MKKWDLIEILYNSREQLKDRKHLRTYPIPKGVFQKYLIIRPALVMMCEDEMCP